MQRLPSSRVCFEAQRAAHTDGLGVTTRCCIPVRRRPLVARLGVVACLLVGTAACHPSTGPDAEEKDLLDTAPPPKASAVERVGALVHNGRAEDGLVLADQSLQDTPKDPELHFVRGMALQALDRPDEAIAAWENAVALKPDMYGALDGIGSAHLDAGRFQQALDALDKALAIKPDFSQAHFNRALALRELGRVDDSLAALRRSAELAPEDHEVFEELAVAYLLVKPADVKSSDQAIAEAIRLNPGGSGGYLVKAQLASLRGEPKGAVAALEAGRKAVPPPAYDLVLELLRAHRAAGDLKAASELGTLLTAELPKQALVWAEHGTTLLALGQVEDGVKALDQALSLSPTMLAAHKRKVQGLIDNKRCADADAAFAAYETAAAANHESERASLKEALRGCGKRGGRASK